MRCATGLNDRKGILIDDLTEANRSKGPFFALQHTVLPSLAITTCDADTKKLSARFLRASTKARLRYHLLRSLTLLILSVLSQFVDHGTTLRARLKRVHAFFSVDNEALLWGLNCKYYVIQVIQQFLESCRVV